jgi:uncharacterized membrane protein
MPSMLEPDLVPQDPGPKNPTHVDLAQSDPSHRDLGHRDPAHRDPAHRDLGHRDPVPHVHDGHLTPDFSAAPLTRQEYIAAMVHLYRGELHRANQWRLRLDHTTNLAVLTTAGLVAYSFGESDHKHWVLIGAVAMITFFLIIEARRFRYADVWRARVRMIEEYFYGPILRRDFGGIGNDWGKLVAEDLFRPRFKMSAFVAIRGRFVKNYWAIYFVTIAAWVTKVLFVPDAIQTWDELKLKLGGNGFIPWWSPLVLVGGFVLAALLLVILAAPVTSYDLEQWKFEKDSRRKGDLDM